MLLRFVLALALTGVLGSAASAGWRVEGAPTVTLNPGGIVLYRCLADDARGTVQVRVEYATEPDVASGSVLSGLCPPYDDARWVRTMDASLMVQQRSFAPGTDFMKSVLRLRRGSARYELEGRGLAAAAVQDAALWLARGEEPLAEVGVALPASLQGPAGPLFATSPALDFWSAPWNQDVEATLAYDSARPVDLTLRWQLQTLRLLRSRVDVVGGALPGPAEVEVSLAAGTRREALGADGGARLRFAALTQREALGVRMVARGGLRAPGLWTRGVTLLLRSRATAWSPPPLRHPTSAEAPVVLEAVLEYAKRFFRPDRGLLAAELDSDGRPDGYDVASLDALAWLALEGKQQDAPELARLVADFAPRRGSTPAAGGEFGGSDVPKDLWSEREAAEALAAVSAARVAAPPERAAAEGAVRAALDELRRRMAARPAPESYQLGKGCVVDRRPSASPLPHALAALALLEGGAMLADEPLRRAGLVELRTLSREHLAQDGQLVAREPATGRVAPAPWDAWAPAAWALGAGALGGPAGGRDAERFGRARLALRRALLELWDRSAGGFPALESGPDGVVRRGARRSLRDQVAAALAFVEGPVPPWPGR